MPNRLSISDHHRHLTAGSTIYHYIICVLCHGVLDGYHYAHRLLP